MNGALEGAFRKLVGSAYVEDRRAGIGCEIGERRSFEVTERDGGVRLVS